MRIHIGLNGVDTAIHVSETELKTQSDINTLIRAIIMTAKIIWPEYQPDPELDFNDGNPQEHTSVPLYPEWRERRDP